MKQQYLRRSGLTISNITSETRRDWIHFTLVAVIVLLARAGGPGASELSYLIIASYSLTGERQALIGLFLTWVCNSFNPGLAEAGQFDSILRFLVPICAATGVAFRSITRGNIRSLLTNKSIRSTATFGIFLIFHSLLFSSIVSVSILKSAAYLLVFATCLICWNTLSQRQLYATTIWLKAGLAMTAILSLPLLVSPTGYLLNGAGFQGLFSHPQAFGVAMAITCVWMLSSILSGRGRAVVYFIVLVTSAILLFLSQARTAAGAVLIATAVGLLIYRTHQSLVLGERRTVTFDRRIGVLIALLFVGGIFTLLFSSSVLDETTSFVFKRGSGSSVSETLWNSRGPMVSLMLDNIQQNPFAGLGFGIASNPFLMEIQREPIFGLPIGAGIEKGVLPIAIVEELGILGLIVTTGWLTALTIIAMRNGLEAMMLTVVILATNLGEASFFSSGAAGLIGILLFTWSVRNNNAHRSRHRTRNFRRL